MKKLLLVILILFTAQQTFSQEDTYPVYKGCDSEQDTRLEQCFNLQLTADVLDGFNIPENVINDNYEGVVTVVFIVTKEGAFEVLYVRSAYQELESEARRVFANLPKAKPATYNGRAIDMRFGMPIHIPLDTQPTPETIVKEATQTEQLVAVPNATSTKKNINTTINSTPFPEHRSELNIPFTHRAYAELDYYYNNDDNAHTTSKPYVYSDAANYVDLDALKNPLFKNKTSQAGKKSWNEHFFTVQAKDYWFTINPMFDLQIGKDNSDLKYTYNNTRAIQIQGGLGKGFNFSASFYESQGRFAEYINDFARANEPAGASSFGLVPGRGRGKEFKNTGFDYPVAEAYLSYTPNQFFNFQFGHGKNFIGDGYRSFMLSDVASPYPFLKINTQFWKIKYSNTWMWLDDVRPEVISNGASARKFVAMHHLSWNVNKRLNIGLFEAVISNNENKDGFDVNFFNPIIFYRAVEFTKGSGAGNALIGLNAKYKLTDHITTYSQFVLDELTVGEFFGGDGYWGNKFALQLGAKYYHAFKIENLTLQGEFNMARPYTYAHEKPTLNYAHFNQPLGHLWGSNFWEAVGIARYKKGRWFGNAKLVFGKKGFDFENVATGYGGDIYTSNDTRTGNTGVNLLQGNKTAIFIGDLQGGYVVNPTTNLQFFGGLTFRNFDPTAETATFSKQNTTWFTIGLKTDIFNWYFDF